MTTHPTDRSADRAAAAIDVQDLHKYFGDNEVLKGIDFHVGQGQVVCVIGPSGSGKSTLLRCVNMLETPTSGETTGTSTSLTQAALLYLIITLPLTRLVAWLEKRQQRAR